nr:EAL domain-containing protein [Thiocystis violacea]
MKEQLERLAYFDGLTGLMNRTLFDDRLGQALGRAQRTRSQVALMFIDLNRFKAVNDTLGHEAGDALLREVARRISERVRGSDAVSRRSGDEFTLLIETCSNQKGVVQLAEDLIVRLSQPYSLAGGDRTSIGASIGIAFYPSDAQTAGELLSRADTAMYAAKERGMDGYCLYSPDLGRAIRSRLALEARLTQAVREEGMEILFQPQVNLTDGRLLGVEAFCRWWDPELGEVPPRIFIPIAEETGAIRPLGLWLLRHACREVAGWSDLGSDFFLSINVSAKQLTAEFPLVVREILEATGWPAQRLELELTEDSLTHAPPEAESVLEALSATGVLVVMDDFGAGYSSLSYLKRFRFGKLKIDRSMIQNLATSEDDNLMVSTFINLSHQLGLRVIAEGVETEAQRDRLLRYGCDMAQGFLYGSPGTHASLSGQLGRQTSDGIRQVLAHDVGEGFEGLAAGEAAAEDQRDPPVSLR